MRRDRRSYLRTALTGGLWLTAGLARAEPERATFPNRPIRIVCTTVAGSATDVVTRQMAAPLAELLKVPVIVDNRAGANGMLAAQDVAKAAPDGYTLLNANIGNAVNDLLRPQAGSRLLQELIPVTDLTTAALILLVNPALPVHTMKELVDYAHANPKSLSYGSGGPGSLFQLTGERLKRALKIELNEVPYKSFGADIVDLMAGNLQVGFGVWSNIGTQIRAGKLRAIAIAAERRISTAPEIPTFAEQGVPNLVATGWNGIFAPAGTPQPIVQKLQRGVAAALASEPFRLFFEHHGGQVGGNPPEQFAAFIRSEKRELARIIQQANIRLE